MNTDSLTKEEKTPFKMKSLLNIFSFKKHIDVLQLVTLSILLLVMLWAFIWIQIESDNKNILENTFRNVSNIQRSFNETTETTLQRGEQLVKIEKFYVERYGDSAYPIVKELFQNKILDIGQFNQIGVINKDGIYDFSNLPDLKRIDLSDREHFKVHKDIYPYGAYVSRPLIGRATNKPSIQLSLRLNKDDGSFNGAAVISFNPDIFLNLYKKMDLGRGGMVSILGEDGYFRTLYIQDSENSFYVDKPIEIPSVMKGVDSGIFISDSVYDNTKRYYSFQKIKNQPLYILAGITEDVAFATFNLYKKLYIAFGLITTLLILIYSVISVRSLLRSSRINEKLIESNHLIEESYSQLEALKLAADTANQTKSKFLATMSHEIRTPLNGILGMAQILLSQKLSPADQQQRIQTILSSGQNLQLLLNDILDFSKVESGKLELIKSTVNINSIISNVKELFSGAARIKSVGLFTESSFPEGKLYIADELRLTQIVSNFVSNAIKFTNQGQVLISGHEISHQGNTAIIELSVTDTGLGISDKNQELLFKTFSQVNANAYSISTGSGLGLSIVRSLVELMKGEYGVDSAEGLGSKFWIRIPVEYLVGEQVEEKKPEPIHSTELILEKLKLKVFIVEDNVTNQMVLASMLRAMSPELSIEIFGDGRQCYERYIKDTNVDLILMDIGMPVLNGDAAAELIRKFEKDNQVEPVTIIAVSAYVYQEDRNRFKAVGMNDFLSKPIEYGYLQSIVRKWLTIEKDLYKIPKVNDEDTVLPKVFNSQAVMQNLGQNKKLAIEVIRSTIQEVPRFFERLYESINESHWVEARSTTHSLKGLIVQLGAEILAKEVIRIDDILHKGGEIAVQDVQNLETLYAELLTAIKADKELSVAI